ncbi:insulinase family protein, partial [Candidatus Dependentiae bacterium]|nr:insulinase family protein [Candidatus Dependentiae bacterium]
MQKSLCVDFFNIFLYASARGFMIKISYNKLRNAFIFFSITYFQSIFSLSINLQQPLKDALSIDPNLCIGTLDNGLRYYIQKNKRPEKQAVINLVVHAGSLNEQEHEQGIAHFLEHLQYKGSENFRDEKEFEKYFNNHGIQSGADKNAYTNWDETGYFFVIPTDNEELFAKTFLTLGDFSGRALLREEAINIEKTVVLDELQMRNSATLRQWYALLPTLMAGTAYPERFPIGKAEVISSATSSTLRNFYQTWYVPRNMTLIAVGDFNVDTVKQLIQSSFGELKDTPVPSTKHILQKPSPKYGHTVFFVDPENGNANFQIFFDLGTFRIRTVNNLRTILIARLCTFILNQRMVTQIYNPKSASKRFNVGITHDFFPNTTCGIASCCPKEGNVPEATKELITLIKQFADHGVSKEEFEWAKKTYKNQNDLLIANANTLPNGFFQNRLNDHFINGDYINITSIPEVTQLETKLLSTIEREDIIDAAKIIFDFDQAVYMLSFNPESYESAGGQHGEETFKTIIAEQTKAKTKSYQAPSVPEIEIVTKQSSAYQEIIDIPQIEAKKIILGNGVTVYFKQTNFSENNINITGFSPGGFDALQEDPVAARIACHAICAMGVGGIKPPQWGAILSEKPNLDVYPSIDLHTRAIGASCRTEDLLLC